MSMLYTTIESPIGELLLYGDGATLHGLHMQDGPGRMTVPPEWAAEATPFGDVALELDEYFAGERVEFDVPLTLAGSVFQRTVWGALQEIPYGQTCSYGELARRIGQPEAVRAVGLANGRNPVAVIVPCHRVIGASGDLVGYGGGLQRKRVLLELEAGVLPLVG